jgi:hypothetical protein
VRLLPKAVDISLPIWVAMHEDQRTSLRIRAVFDHLVEGLAAYGGSRSGTKLLTSGA